MRGSTGDAMLSRRRCMQALVFVGVELGLRSVASLMPTLTVPSPVAPGTVAAVAGAGFANAKTRLLLDGWGSGSNIFRPRKDGTFNVGITVASTARTQTLVAQQLSGSTWTDRASVSVVVAVPAPTPVPVPPTPVPTPVPPPDPAYTFQDEFPLPGLDLSKWTTATEWQTTGLGDESLLDPKMVSIVGTGQLQLRCQRNGATSGRQWTGAVVCTKPRIENGVQKGFAQLYGNFKARLMYPAGQGGWPAWWALDSTSTGRRSELDVMESYPFGTRLSKYSFTSHLKKPDGTIVAHGQSLEAGYNLTGAFHVFEMEWRKDLLISLLDGKEMYRSTLDVPAVPMFLILNNVIGSWAGQSDATTPSPYDMLVDWVRVTA